MPQNVDTLAISDSADEDVQALLRLVYRTSPVVRVVSNHADFVSVLKGYQSIRRLILMLEGNSGSVIVRGVLKSLEKYAEEFSGALVRVQDEIVFDGCNIALGCVEIAAFMKALHAPKASGFTTYHVLEHETIVVPKSGTEPKSIESSPRYALIRDFLLPGQPTANDLATRPGSHTLYYEYFSRRMKGRGDRLEPNDRPFVYARSRLVERVIKVDPVNDGQSGAIESLRSESASLDTMGGAPFFVVLTDSKAKIR